MKNILKISVVLFVGLSLIVSSCKKEEDEVVINGCTDSSAMNYLSDATSNNGSCIYAHEIMEDTWDIEEYNCNGLLMGSLLGQVESVEIQGGDDEGDLIIDFGAAGQFSGSISSDGDINIPPQTALSLGSVSGDGKLNSNSNATITLTITVGVPPLVTTEICDITLTL